MEKRSFLFSFFLAEKFSLILGGVHQRGRMEIKRGWVGRFSTKPTENHQEIERQFLNHEL